MNKRAGRIGYHVQRRHKGLYEGVCIHLWKLYAVRLSSSTMHVSISANARPEGTPHVRISKVCQIYPAAYPKYQKARRNTRISIVVYDNYVMKGK
jgi:hypothetical protein